MPASIRETALAAVLLTVAGWPAQAQQRGQAEVAIQGYYLGDQGQSLSDISGLAIRFQDLIPELGLINANFEAYGGEGKLRAGENYLELRDAVWQGLRWNLLAGDAHVPGGVLPSPFFNLFVPEMMVRGLRIEAGDRQRQFTLFYGTETLQVGPRIPYRMSVPQKVLGASLRQSKGGVEVGLRLLHVSNHLSPDGEFDLPGWQARPFSSADNFSLYSSYKVSESFRWYGEVTAARMDGVSLWSAPSYFVGPAYESPAFSFRANYASLGPAYLPIAGFIVGDRKGPFGEMRFRPFKRLELFASANRYENNLDRDPRLETMRSTGLSAGVSLELPWKFSVSSQLSTIRVSTSGTDSSAPLDSDNRQLSLTLSRPLGSQTLRLTARDLRMVTNGSLERQRAAEVEDLFRIRRVTLGAAVRGQQRAAAERADSIFVRGSAQADFGRLGAFAYLEAGHDLLNQTLFAANTMSTTVAGVTARLTRDWSLSLQAFRTNQVAQLNPESAFVLANQGVAVSPVVLSEFNQWSFLFRLSRSFSWGGGLAVDTSGHYQAGMRELTGVVEGLVSMAVEAGVRPVPGIPVRVENGRTAWTGADGRFRLEQVPEGPHTVSLSAEELPAEYNPGPHAQARVEVSPRRPARADLDVSALGTLRGKVIVRGGPFDTLEGMLIRVSPGTRYTTTLADGSFALYNLLEGDYEVWLAPETLPEEARLTGAGRQTVTVHASGQTQPLEFEIRRQAPASKPVRKVLEQQIEPSSSSR